MSDPPVITVIVPVRDEAPYVGAQLEALGRQTFDRPWELIVVDHNSTDGTPDIVREWQKRLPNLRLEHAPLARHAGGVRNRGAELASAELLAFCDGDDVVSDGWLAAMVEGLVDHDLVVGPQEVTRINPPGSYRYRPPMGGIETHGNGRFIMAIGLNFAVHRAAYLAVLSDDTLSGGEDIDFGIRLADAGYSRSHFTSAALVHRRLRETSGGLFRQHSSYGYAGVVLLMRHGSRLGWSRPPLRLAARELAFLVVRVYWLLDWSKRRHWMVIAGRHAGRLSASLRYRIFYP